MAGEIRADPDILRGHARGVSVLAEDLDDALAAAQSVNLGGGAFGVLCAFLVPPAGLASSMAVASLRSAGSMLRRAAAEVNGWADDADETESQIVSDIRAIAAALDGA
ncbi:MAG: hypothetical protein ABF811_00505 [Pseudoclavibacter sp.]